MGYSETFEKYEFLFEFEKGEIFNQRNTLGILRINPPKFGGGLKFESDKEIGQKFIFCKGLTPMALVNYTAHFRVKTIGSLRIRSNLNK